MLPIFLIFCKTKTIFCLKINNIIQYKRRQDECNQQVMLSI